MKDNVLRIIAKHATRDDFAKAPVAIATFCNDIQKMRLTAAEAEPYIEEFYSVSRSKGKLFDQFSEKLKLFRSDEDVIARLNDPGRKRFQTMTAEGKVLKSLKATLTIVKRVLADQESIFDMREYFHLVNQIRTILSQIEK